MVAVTLVRSMINLSSHESQLKDTSLLCTLTPNPSLKLTRYGRRCKPGPRYPVHFLEPGLQHLPPRAA